MEEWFFKRLKNKEDSAFIYIFDTYKLTIYRTAYLILRDAQYAEDVVQETFLKVYLNIDKLNNYQCFETWLHRIAYNLSLTNVKKIGKQSIPQPIEDSDEKDVILLQNEATPEDSAIAKHLQKQCMDCIYKLKVNYRTVFILHFYNDFTISQISEIMDCSEGTVKSRLFYGKKKLKKLLKSLEVDIE